MDSNSTEPNAIFIFDDVLTAGCHYKAIEIVLRNRFPNTPLRGLFLARAVPQPQENDENLLGLPMMAGKKMGLTVTSTKSRDGERTYSVEA
jgi:hypothetical protein